MHCIPESELNPANTTKTSTVDVTSESATTQNDTNKTSTDNVAESLRKLNALKEAGSISDEEFEKMKKDVLSRI